MKACPIKKVGKTTVDVDNTKIKNRTKNSGITEIEKICHNLSNGNEDKNKRLIFATKKNITNKKEFKPNGV
jgi:hypothetical protein